MKIVATILFVIAMLAAALPAVRCFNEASGMKKIESSGGLASSLAKSMLGDIPSSSAFTRGGIVSSILALTMIFGIVATFMKSKKIGLAGAGAAGLMALLAILLVPSFVAGRYGPPNPKTLAIVAAVIALGAAASLFMVANKRTE